MKNNKIKILDCTLRDGGYYNNWDFSEDLVNKYLSAVGNSGIDIIEVGFRFLPKNKFLGSLAYSTDDYLSTLDLPKHCRIGVMINAKEIINFEYGPKEAINKLFRNAKESPVSLVRIAAHFNEYSECYPIVRELYSMGYKVGFNLMQAGGKSKKELSNAASEIKEWKELDVLYFADSLGNMDSDDVKNTINGLRSGGWDKSMGIHTHDNMGEALNNSLVALDNGVDWIDATILGMGRGPGNAKMEYLLLELCKRNVEEYFPDSLFEIVLDQFRNLQSQYRWGSSLLYYLSAEYGIHPTYVQEMTGKIQMDAHQKVEALKFLSKSDSSGYSSQNLNEAFLREGGSKEGSWSCNNWLSEDTVLIIGPGSSTEKYQSAIINYIKFNKPKVISLNINNIIPSEYIDAYAACHHMRVLMDSDRYSKLDKPLIIPLDSVPPSLKNKLDNIEILDYGMSIKSNIFEFEENGCTIPKPLVFLYTLALAHSAKASKVLLVGFDGYDKHDPRQIEMEEVIYKYKQQVNALEIIAITPSTYGVDQSSVYSLSQ